MKSSKIIHREIFEMLYKHHIDVMKLKGIIHAAGPGSYTGVRLSYGMSQIFEWQGIKSYGFYHFDVPYFFGIKNGCWIARAFKGEIFNYCWESKKNNISLLPEKNFFDSYSKGSLNEKESLYTHFPESLDQSEVMIYSTHQMIKEKPIFFFKHIVENNITKKPYYFRTLEKEFKPPKV
ncbi:MAG: hypothetical protein OXB88_11140 [Bacteriovoracales bacterium]|nr:hypothetical protein [Bacteriovoracales bacterium]